MPRAIFVRTLTLEEGKQLQMLARSRTESARDVERAQIVLLSHGGMTVPAIAKELRRDADIVRMWVKRFNASGLAGLQDEARSGRPATYTAEQVSEIVAAALTPPRDLGLPFASWTLDRLQAYLSEAKGIGMKRSRIDEILGAEGLRWRKQESWFGERVDPEFAEKKGRVTQLYTAPPPESVVLCVDEMGPESAKSFLGQGLVHRPDGQRPAERARQEIDYGRRGKGYIFGAFRPATGDALTETYDRRTTANFVDFLERVEQWVPAEIERLYVILDNLQAHRATDVLLFSLGHPRWEFVFQPKYAAYLNLIEPWWKVLRSLALKGRRFETWSEVEQAIAEATDYWNQHKHPFHWGHRRRHHPKRVSGIAVIPNVPCN